jgi:hypothetical protein
LFAIGLFTVDCRDVIGGTGFYKEAALVNWLSLLSMTSNILYVWQYIIWLVSLYIHVTVHHNKSLFNNQPDASIIQMYSVIKLYTKLTNAECTVENSWCWAEKIPDTCRVL